MIRHTLFYPVFVLIVVITDDMTMSLSDEEYKLRGTDIIFVILFLPDKAQCYSQLTLLYRFVLR